MNISMLRTKIHRATVTEADLNYEGSVSICPDLIKASGLLLHEKVDIYISIYFPNILGADCF